MAESFEDRVKRLFGSKLFESVPENSFPTSSWSVTNGDVERREWNRERNLGSERDEDERPCSSSFYDENGCLLKKKSRRVKDREFEGDFDDLDDDGDEDERENVNGDDEGREERDIRNSIGLDPTLDNEEEEDEYDKAALCRENATERVYMRDVKDHGPYINYHNVVPDFFDEPDESLYFHKEDKNITVSVEPTTASSVKITESDVNLKPILKRKEPHTDQKPKKRVRFDHNEAYKEPQDSMETSNTSLGVPDYLRNPSKYTHYTFDSSEGNEGEESNRRAFEDFLNLVKKPTDFTVEIPKSVTFTPRKKSISQPMADSPVSNKELGQVSGFSVADETEACGMDEDDREDPVADTSVKVRGSRQYRSKSTPDDSS